MNETTPKISVIVPVYKAEAYLHRCVDSILAQTFQDFEVLLVDDGSPDRSGEICEEYARKDSRVRVFHKENGGVSSARNMGLDNARGEYVCFVDSDDWINQKMFEMASRYFFKTDIIRFSYQDIFSEDGFERKKNILCEYTDKEEFLSQLIEQKTYVAIWGTFYKRNLFSSEIRFDNRLVIGEDWLALILLVNRCRNFKIINAPLYNYNKYNESSCISAASIAKKSSVFLALEKISMNINCALYENELQNVKLQLLCSILAFALFKQKYLTALKILSQYLITTSFKEIVKSTLPIKKRIFLLTSKMCSCYCQIK